MRTGPLAERTLKDIDAELMLVEGRKGREGCLETGEQEDDCTLSALPPGHKVNNIITIIIIITITITMIRHF
jgi:hypothetical protein